MYLYNACLHNYIPHVNLYFDGACNMLLCHLRWLMLLMVISLVPRPFEGEEKGPGTHCMRMCKVYGAFSSIIRWILSPPHGQTCTDLTTPYFQRLLYSRHYIMLSAHFKQTFLGFRDLIKSLRCCWATDCVNTSDDTPKTLLNMSRDPSLSFFIVSLLMLLAYDS